jgi:hypothetical protein
VTFRVLSRAPVAALLVTAFLGLTIGVGLHWAVGRGTASGAAPSPPAEAPPGVRYFSSLADSMDRVYAMTWLDDDQLYYVQSSIAGAVALHRFRLSTGEISTWEVPISAPLTPHTYLAVDSKATIWLAVGYLIASFDPATGTFTSTRENALNSAFASSDALDPANPLPGTWFNGLMAAGDGSILATRQNVLAVLSESDAGEAVVAQLEKKPAALLRVGGVPTPVAFDGGEAVSIGSGSAGGRISRTTAESAMCGIQEDAASAAISVRSPNGPAALSGLRLHPFDLAAQNSAGDTFVAGLYGQGAIVRVRCSPAVTAETFQLPSREVDKNVVNGGDHTVNPVLTASPEAIAVSPTGHLGFSDSAFDLGVIE